MLAASLFTKLVLAEDSGISRIIITNRTDGQFRERINESRPTAHLDVSHMHSRATKIAAMKHGQWVKLAKKRDMSPADHIMRLRD